MGVIWEKVDPQGRISIKKILQGTNIKPGDLVEIIPGKNKIILRVTQINRPFEIIEKVAGKWKNRPDIAADILSMREEAERRISDFE